MRKFDFAALALAVSGPALAQQPPPPASGQEIVVEANRDRDRQVREFVKALTPVKPYDGQLSRFEWSVCPLVIGLPETQKVVVRSRIRQIAQAVGITLAAENCRANVLVIVADDKDDTLKWMEKALPAYFTNSAGRPIRIRRDESHAVAWHVGDMLNADGRQVVTDRNGVAHVDSTYASRIRPNTRPHFLAAVLIVDVKALAGLTTTEFGDYAAMRVFADIDPEKLKGQAAPTILTILDAPMGSPLPLTLTQWDLGFLRGLYSATENQWVGTQRQEIARSVRKEMTEGESRPGE